MKKRIFNPFLPLDEYIPDGEPHVFDGRVYLFGSHDLERGEDYCAAGNYVCYSAPVDDLTSWQYHGEIYNLKQHPGSTAKGVYAPDVVRGNDGKFYLYYATDEFDSGTHVAVCDTPAGKYKYLGFVRNPDGTKMMKFIPGDPAVINDNGTIRLYYGWALSMVASLAHTGRVVKNITKEMILESEIRLFKRTGEDVLASEGGSVMGAVTCTLADDMLTVTSEPKRIAPGQFMAAGTSFEGHAFFEASSIRKIGDTYYFIYSSENCHELCYATSKYPDRDFVYGGTIISNCDVGYHGRKPEDRLNMTDNNHGSIENIGGKWYIFYHRHTHRSSFSRQACAEHIEILPDGSIPQVEVTSMGLNDGPLEAEGEYPAVMCCNLTNGHMPQIIRRTTDEDIPYITDGNGERYITNIKQGTMIGYKYFAFAGTYEFSLSWRGEGGVLTVSDGENALGKIALMPAKEWTQFSCKLAAQGVKPLYLTYSGEGTGEMLNLSFLPQKDSTDGE